MIQIKRGSTKAWQDSKEKLAAGQPAYDKDRHKLKIGDGEHPYTELPDVTGLFKDEILAEYTPREITGNVILDTLNKLANPDPVFTYGDKKPEEIDRGDIYFQKYDGAVEADYVIEYGLDANYYYRKWNSGFIECWGNSDIKYTERLQSKFKTIFYNTKIGNHFEVKGSWKD